MSRRRSIVALVVAGACLAGARGRRAAADDLANPPPDAVFVRTTFVPAEGDPPAGLVRTTALPVQFEFVEDEGYPIGTMTVGARRLSMALVRGIGSEGVLVADVNGDGRPSRADESFPVTVSPWMHHEQAVGLLWKSKVTWGAGAFGLTIRDRIGTLTGQWTAKPEGSDAKPAAPSTLAFDPDVPASITKPPVTAARVRYATFTLPGVNGGAERTVIVASLRGAKDELSFLVDGSGSGDLTDLSRRVAATAQPIRRGALRTGTTWTSEPVEVLGSKGVLTAVETLPSIQGIADPTGSRCGTTKVAGEPWTVVLLDGDFDGAYTGALDWWGFAPSDAVVDPNPNRLFEGDQPCWRASTKAWRLLGVRADGTAVIAPLAKPPPVEDYLHARSERVEGGRWFPKFESEREEFFRGQGIDPARPQAKTPTHWRHALTLEEARAIARAEGKPLLVDFEADWCVWCKRLDWAIYPDQEVAQRVERFTPVKINIELDPVQSFQALAERYPTFGGLPAIAVVDAEGAPVSFKPTWAKAKSEVVDHIDGFKKPDEFAAALDAAWAAVTGKAAPGGAGDTVTPAMDGGSK